MSEALIHGFLFGEGHPARRIDAGQVRAWSPDQGNLWAHFDAGNAETRDYMTGTAGLPSLVAEAILATETRPRCNPIGDGLLLVLRGVNLNPGADPEDMVSVRLWIEKDRIISTRLRSLLSIEDTVATMEDRPPTGTADILLRIVSRMVDRINDVINTQEDQAADLENSVVEVPGQELRVRLSDQRREAIMLRRYLAPQREALSRLYSDTPDWFSELDRMRLREIYDRQVRLVEDLDAVRERLTVIHEELVSRLSDQLNQRMYVLSIVAALFLPLGFLTGLLGINVGGIPGAENDHAFWIFVGLLVILVGLQVWVFARKKWL